jgi:hypothetical protein
LADNRLLLDYSNLLLCRNQHDRFLERLSLLASETESLKESQLASFDGRQSHGFSRNRLRLNALDGHRRRRRASEGLRRFRRSNDALSNGRSLDNRLLLNYGLLLHNRWRTGDSRRLKGLNEHRLHDGHEPLNDHRLHDGHRDRMGTNSRSRWSDRNRCLATAITSVRRAGRQNRDGCDESAAVAAPVMATTEDRR